MPALLLNPVRELQWYHLESLICAPVLWRRGRLHLLYLENRQVSWSGCWVWESALHLEKALISFQSEYGQGVVQVLLMDWMWLKCLRVTQDMPKALSHRATLWDFSKKEVRYATSSPGRTGFIFSGQRNCRWKNILHNGASEKPTKVTINVIGILNKCHFQRRWYHLVRVSIKLGTLCHPYPSLPQPL